MLSSVVGSIVIIAIIARVPGVASEIDGVGPLCEAAETYGAADVPEAIVRVYGMSGCDAYAEVMRSLIPEIRKNKNALTLEVVPMGSGTYSGGFSAYGGSAAVMADLHLLCAQPSTTSATNNLPTTDQFYDYAECLATRPDPNVLPLEECAIRAGVYDTIQHCSSGNANMAWNALERAYQRAGQRHISKSPTIEIYWNDNSGREPTFFCAERSRENFEGFACAAAVALDRSSNGSPFDAATLSSAETLLNVFDAHCDGSGSPTAESTCETGYALDSVVVTLFYLLPVFLVGVFLIFGASSVRRRLREISMFAAPEEEDGDGARQRGRSRWSSSRREERIAAKQRVVELQRMPTQSAASCGCHASALNCAICLDNVEASENVYGLACGHVFHRKCLKGWIEQKNECPVCRAKVIGGRNKRVDDNDVDVSSRFVEDSDDGDDDDEVAIV